MYFFPVWFQTVMLTSAFIAGKQNYMPRLSHQFLNFSYRSARLAKQYRHGNRIPVCWVHALIQPTSHFPLTPCSQVVNAQNGEVQVHQSNVRHPPLHSSGPDSNHERRFESCETLVEYCTENSPSDRSARF
jgi:hypothetical protein